MTYIDEVIKWACSLPGWESDALRRLYDSPLSEEDIKQVYINLESHYGLQTETPVVQIPFIEAHDSGGASTTDIGLRLKALNNLQKVNRILDGASLSFAVNGLTVFYGDNGSGKSGYGRVFKRACRARHAGGAIHPDLFIDVSGSPGASAQFVLTHKDGDISIDWTDGANSIPLLKHIAVFDKQCARVHATEDNEVDYIPYGSDILEKLVSLCDSLRVKIRTDIDKARPRLNDFPIYEVGIEAHNWLESISIDTSPEQIDGFITLSEEESIRYERLKPRVLERKLKEPARLADELDRRAKRYERLLYMLKVIADSLSETRVIELHALLIEYCEVDSALQSMLLSMNLGDQPLAGIGSKTWRLLFEAARKYASEEAYPGEEYRSTFDKYCVLCQQTLGSEANERMARFDMYISSELSTNLAELSDKLHSITNYLMRLELDLLPKESEILDDVNKEYPELRSQICAWLANADSIRNAVIDLLNIRIPRPEIEGLKDSTVIMAVDNIVQDLKARSEGARSSTPSEVEINEENELRAFEDRLLLGKHKTKLQELVKAKQHVHKLELCYQAMDTQQITKKQTELLNQEVTEKLCNALSQELSNLCVPMKARFEKGGRKGRLHHRIIIEGLNAPKSGLAEILSEGEELVIAIAAFIAELSLAPSISIIVLDDPVSSLDHRWRERVATRIVSLAQERQVIVFTHDIYFLFEVKSMAETYLQERCLIQVIGQDSASKKTGALYPDDSWPAQIISTKRWIGKLRKYLPLLRNHLKAHDIMSREYEVYVGEGYDMLRCAWERAIEEKLFAGVIERHKPNISFERLKDITSDITTNQIEIVRNNMAKASRWISGHTKTASQRGQPPNPDEFEKDIKVLEDFVASRG